MIEDHLPAVVGFVEEVQIVQHGGVVEHSLDDLMATNTRYLKYTHVH